MASLMKYQKNGEMVEPPLYKYMKGNVQGLLNSIPDPSKMTKEDLIVYMKTLILKPNSKLTKKDLIKTVLSQE